MRHIIILILCITIYIPPVFADNCSPPIELFLNNPNYRNYLMVIDQTTVKQNENCWEVLKSNNKYLLKLYKNARRGSRWSIEIVAKHLSSLDGGNLEDAFVALGESIDVAPNVIFSLYKNQNITKNQFEKIITTLSLKYVDDKKGKIKALETRQIYIKKYTTKKYIEQKNEAISILTYKIESINKIWP